MCVCDEWVFGGEVLLAGCGSGDILCEVCHSRAACWEIDAAGIVEGLGYAGD